MKLFVLYFFLLLHCQFIFLSVNASPQAGVLDLRDKEINQEFITSLNGEWAFYWKNFLSHSEVKRKSPDIYLNVPSYWSDAELNGKKLPGNG